MIAKLIIERIVRQAITAAGGVMVMSSDEQAKIAGAASIVLAFLWSLFQAFRDRSKQSKSDSMSKASLVALALLPLATAVLLTGCVSTKVKSPSGWQASRQAFGINATVGEFSIEANTNGLWKANLKGYQSEGVQTIKAVAEGVASGLKP